VDEDKFVYVNSEKEGADLVHPDHLKIISGRKLWMKKHGIKLKKRNKRLEKKGIFM